MWTRLKTESETTGLRACEARAVRAHKSLTPRVTDFFTDFEEKNPLFCSLSKAFLSNYAIWKATFISVAELSIEELFNGTWAAAIYTFCCCTS